MFGWGLLVHRLSISKPALNKDIIIKYFKIGDCFLLIAFIQFVKISKGQSNILLRIQLVSDHETNQVRIIKLIKPI